MSNPRYPTFRHWLNDQSLTRLPISPTLIVTENRTAGYTTSSTTYTPITGLSRDVTYQGDFLVWFNGVVEYDNDNASGPISIFVNGTQVQGTEIEKATKKDIMTEVSILAMVTNLNEGDIIDIRWRINSNSGTLHYGSLHTLKL